MGGIIVFISVRQFAAMKARGEFAEWAKVHDYFYGTPRKTAGSEHSQRDEDILLDIDVQGARKIKQAYPRSRVDLSSAAVVEGAETAVGRARHRRQGR